MFKRILCVFCSVVMVFSMISPAVYADDEIMNHEHNWVDVPVSLKGEVFGMEYQVSIKHCTICNLYDHTISLAGYSYEYFAMTAAPGVEGIIQNLAIKLYCSIFGENATATKFTPGGGSTSGGGVGRPKGYDDNGTALVSNDGMQRVRATFKFFLNYDSDKQPIESFTTGTSSFYAVGTPGQVILTSENSSGTIQFSGGYFPVQQLPGYYTLPAGTEVYNFNYYQGNTNYPQTPTITSRLSGYGRASNYKNFYISSTETNVYFFYVNDYSHESKYSVNSYNTAGFPKTYSFKGSGSGRKILIAPHDIYLDYTPVTSSTNLRTYTQYNITNNNINNTWNGNIYTDNSTNLTYIYPQYTTVNEKNETVTNISTTPIIYNNETKQYYTYDQTTKNYYYITYNENPTTSTPSPSPTPDPDNPSVTPTPTPKPGGSISTPETGKPGGSSGSSWWDKLLSKIGDTIIDGLLGAVSAVLKLIFKLFSTILSWIIWAVSRVFDLLPFLPPGLGGLLVGGVVVCFVIGIIKFIRG